MSPVDPFADLRAKFPELNESGPPVSLNRHIKLTPGDPLWELRERFAKLNAPQFTKVLGGVLEQANVQINPTSAKNAASENFRVGVLAGMFFTIGVGNDKEAALTSSEPCIALLAKILYGLETQQSIPDSEKKC